ncbi:integral membrane transport protein [Sesbania bispinosa]|nr:integral membrane transport protein [Sesbania bispinosa]
MSCHEAQLFYSPWTVLMEPWERHADPTDEGIEANTWHTCEAAGEASSSTQIVLFTDDPNELRGRSNNSKRVGCCCTRIVLPFDCSDVAR